MPIYLMLTSLTDEGRKTIKEKPERIKEVNQEVEMMGVKGRMDLDFSPFEPSIPPILIRVSEIERQPFLKEDGGGKCLRKYWFHWMDQERQRWFYLMEK